MNSFKDTIVALATPNGSGAIAMIRLSGEEVIKMLIRYLNLRCSKKD